MPLQLLMRAPPPNPSLPCSAVPDVHYNTYNNTLEVLYRLTIPTSRGLYQRTRAGSQTGHYHPIPAFIKEEKM